MNRLSRNAAELGATKFFELDELEATITYRDWLIGCVVNGCAQTYDSPESIVSRAIAITDALLERLVDDAEETFLRKRPKDRK